MANSENGQISLEGYIKYGLLTDEKFLFTLNENFFGGAGGFVFCTFAKSVIVDLLLTDPQKLHFIELANDWVARLQGNIPDYEFLDILNFTNKLIEHMK